MNIRRPATPTAAIVARKLRSARVRFRQAVMQLRDSQLAARKKKAFDAWASRLRRNPPDVLIGSNLAGYGGVRNHLRAIQHHSSLRTELAPPDDLLEVVSVGEMKTVFRDAFMALADDVRVKTVHSHVFPWFIEWCARARRNGSLWVHTYHAPYFAEYAVGELLPWQREINEFLIEHARHADVRLSVSRWQADWLRSHHGIETEYLPNAVDVAFCDKGDASRARARFGDEPFVLYVGRNDPVKNPADFVRLAARVPAQRFVMIGHELTADVLRTEWQVEVPPNVIVAGEATHLEVQDALAACAALVVTSRREGLPTLVMEAMAHSKPVVVPDEQGCVETIAGGDYGFIYAPGDIDDLEAKLVEAMTDSTRSSRARGRVLAEYDWLVIAPALDRIYTGQQ